MTHYEAKSGTAPSHHDAPARGLTVSSTPEGPPQGDGEILARGDLSLLSGLLAGAVESADRAAAALFQEGAGGSGGADSKAELVITDDDFIYAVVDEYGLITQCLTSDGKLLAAGIAGAGPPEGTDEGAAFGTVKILDSVAYFPKPSGIITLDFTMDGPLPTTRGQKPRGMLTMNVDGCTMHVPGMIQIQGATSVRYPKKSWMLRFFADEAHQEPIRVKFGDSVPSARWMAKADWVDPTMLRTVLSYRLWEQMMLSRDGLPKKEVDNAWWGKTTVKEGMTGAAIGSPRVYPMVMTINGEFYGLMIMTLKDEPENYNLDPDNPDHIYFDFDARGRGGDYGLHKCWKKFSSDGIDDDEDPVGNWIQWEYPDWNEMEAPAKQKARDLIDSAGAVINSSQEDFNRTYHHHFDRTNLIDYLLMVDALGDYDGVTQDIQIFSYDMQKLYCLPWDKDTTFGMHFNNTGVSKAAHKDVIELDKPGSQATREQVLWRKIYHAETAAVEARYAQLRDGDVFTTDNIYRLIMDLCARISPELWDAEYEKWNRILILNNGRPDESGRPRSARDETSIHQILHWFKIRLAYLDARYNYTPDQEA